jgi:DNA-binding LacI/PurR family transcriptional regulator
MSVSMRDVASRAKVSVATVSKCLRGKPGIPEKTRQSVVETARRMGYRTHPYISALMQSRRKRKRLANKLPILAYVTALRSPDTWLEDSFSRDLFGGASERAEARGYVFSPFWLFRDGMSNQRFSEMLRSRGIRGLLFNPVPNPGTRLDLTWSYFSVVAHGLSIAHPIFHRTSNDHFASMMLALDECRKLGYRRPGVVLEAPVNQRLEYRWESAYFTGRLKLGFGESMPPLLLPNWELDRLGLWIRSERPDVLLGPFHEEEVDELAAGGFRVPGDLGIVSLSVRNLGSPLSGIYQDPKFMGATAADKLIDLVERNETGIPQAPITLTIAGQWNPGRTVAARLSRSVG